MGVEPISTIVILGAIAVGTAAYLANQAEEERREKIRRNNEIRRRNKEIRRLDRARRREERWKQNNEQVEEESSEDQEESSEDEEFYSQSRRRENFTRATNHTTYDDMFGSSCMIPRRNNLCQCGYCNFNSWTSDNYNDSSYRNYDDMFGSSYMIPRRNNLCQCGYCNFNSWTSDNYNDSSYRNYTDYSCQCGSCRPSYKESEEKDEQGERQRYDSENHKLQNDLFTNTKKSITLKITPPPAKVTSPSSRSTATGSSAKHNNSSAASRSQSSKSPSSTASGSGSQQPQRNENNKKSHEQSIEKFDGTLSSFIKLLISILDLHKCTPKLRETILGFFKNFEKHEQDFLRLLSDLTIEGINHRDVLSIVVQLFQSDAFSRDVTYQNFKSLIEFVTQFLKDEAALERAAEFEKLIVLSISDSIKRIVQRTNLLDSIAKIFNNIRLEIIDDNLKLPLDLDFSDIFTKVYHYFKHRVVRGKILTVKEYFDWVRKLIPLVTSLNPEFTELMDQSHERRQIIFEMYVTAFAGRIRIVLRIFNGKVKICTVFVRERKEKGKKDGDIFVDYTFKK